MMDKIKYHQNGIGNEYGADGKLTDNWNPDGDYGNEYVRVYFRINTPSYHYNNGFDTEDNKHKWETEVSNLIKSFGILEDCDYAVEHSKDKQPYLYAHPQDISGVVLKNDVRKIAETISNMKFSSIRWVDLYETIYVMSDSEYEKYLDGKASEICKALFEKSSTTRTTKYYNAFDVARYIAGLVRINRLGVNDGRHYGGGQTVDYVLKMADKMIEKGYLKCFTDGDIKYIRSLNKTEQKKMKIK